MSRSSVKRESAPPPADGHGVASPRTSLSLFGIGSARVRTVQSADLLTTTVRLSSELRDRQQMQTARPSVTKGLQLDSSWVKDDDLSGRCKVSQIWETETEFTPSGLEIHWKGVLATNITLKQFLDNCDNLPSPADS